MKTTMKRGVSLLLTLCLLASSIPAGAERETAAPLRQEEEVLEPVVLPESEPAQLGEVKSGSRGTAVTWTLDMETGVLTISGSGAMYYYSQQTPWYEYRSSIISVVIEEGVTSICNYAFDDYSSLTSVTIPGSVTSIGSSAFRGCTGLTGVTIPGSVTTIGDYAFYSCTGLTSVTISKGVTSIGSSAFRGCAGLTSVTISEGVTSIGASAFNGCSSLTSITIPDGVTSIGASAFNGCSSLTSITIPDSVTSIGNGAFYGCSGLTSITIPDSVTSIGNYAFYGCSSLTSATIGNGVTRIGDDAFSNCYSLTSVYISNLATWCGIFFGNSSANPLCYARNLYLNGELVKDLVIPDSVTSIGEYAFYVCSSLTSVTIPGSVTSIGSSAFYGCAGLTSVYISDLAAWCGISFGDFDANPLRYARNLYVNGELVKTLVIPEGVTSIGKHAFSGCSSLTRITIPDNVTSIGDSAFSGCSNLESITLPFVGFSRRTGTDTYQYPFGYIFGTRSYTGGRAVNQYYTSSNNATYYIPSSLKHVTITGGSIPDRIFYNCADLTSISIPDSVTSIGKYAFYGCSSLTSITIPDGVTSIGNEAFSECSSLTSITIGSGVTSIGQYAFDGCSSLTSITIPDSVTSIGEYAFFECSSLTSITIGSGVTSISWYAFSKCSSLTSITIPDSVTSIGRGAFSGCSSLTSITIPDGVTSIGLSAFSGCSGLTSITIPDGVTSIGLSAFSGCSGLTSITIPDGVTSIGNDAFSGCSSLKWAEFMGSAPTSGSNIFYNCDSNFFIKYHKGTTGWTSPTWGGSPCYRIEVDDYTALNADNKNDQDILFTLNDDAYTAIVGTTSTSGSNTSGYSGAGLGSVVIPATVSKNGIDYRVIAIGPNAFSGNNVLTDITLGANISSLNESTAFNSCKNFQAFAVAPGSRYSVQDGVLYDYGKSVLYRYPQGKTDASFTVPDSVFDISAKAFLGVSALREITIPDTVETVGANAFSSTALECVTMPFIGHSAQDTQPLSYSFSTSIPRKVTITQEALTASVFKNCSALEQVIFTLDCETIPASAFDGCTSLAYLKIGADEVLKDGEMIVPDTITHIGDRAFQDCSNLTTATLGTGVKSIGSRAFSGCNTLKQVEIGVDVTSISNDAFRPCAALKKIVVSEDNGSYCSDKWGVLYTAGKRTLVQYPSGRSYPYYNVPDETTTILESAFYNNANLINLYIPDGVTSIQRGAIYNCPNVTLCIRRRTPAAEYANNNSFSVYYIDNLKLLDVEAEQIPENGVVAGDVVSSINVYIVGNYGPIKLQLEEYDVLYTDAGAGLQSVSVSYNGAEYKLLNVLHYDSEKRTLLDFGAVPTGVDPENDYMWCAIYDENGKMTSLQNVLVSNGRSLLAADKGKVDSMKEAKLFFLCKDNLAAEAIPQRIGRD